LLVYASIFVEMRRRVHGWRTCRLGQTDYCVYGGLLNRCVPGEVVGEVLELRWLALGLHLLKCPPFGAESPYERTAVCARVPAVVAGASKSEHPATTANRKSTHACALPGSVTSSRLSASPD
jgi:hypothetical protein